MLRLSPPRHGRITDGDIFEKRAGGAELNVASGVALLGLRTAVIAKLPANKLGTFLKNRIRFIGVSDDFLVYDESPEARLGLYYYEMGAAPRKPTIVYDRKESSATRIRLDEIPEEVLHLRAHVPHLRHQPGAVPRDARGGHRADPPLKKGGALISFDVNYRANLWSEDEARETIKQILPLVDVLFISEETSRRMFQKTGSLHDIMKSYTQEYGVKMVATTQRTVISPRKHNFTSMVYWAQTDTFLHRARVREHRGHRPHRLGRRVCGGRAVRHAEYGDPEQAMRFGNAMSSVKNTVSGDLPDSDIVEIERIIREHNTNGPVSEMNR